MACLVGSLTQLGIKTSVHKVDKIYLTGVLPINVCRLSVALPVVLFVSRSHHVRWCPVLLWNTFSLYSLNVENLSDEITMALALFDSTICIIVFRGNQTMQIAAYGHVISLYSNNCQFDIKPRYRVYKMILPYNNSRQCIPFTRCILCLQTKCQTLKSFKSLKKEAFKLL